MTFSVAYTSLSTLTYIIGLPEFLFLRGSSLQKQNFITAHVVHHCTFCASLHFKTSPDSFAVSCKSLMCFCYCIMPFLTVDYQSITVALL